VSARRDGRMAVFVRTMADSRITEEEKSRAGAWAASDNVRYRIGPFESRKMTLF